MDKIITFLKNITLGDIAHISIALLILLTFNILSSFLAYGLLKIFFIKKSKEEIKKICFYSPLQIFFSVIGAYIAILFLDVSAEMQEFANKILRISMIILTTISLSKAISNQSNWFKKLSDRFKFNRDDTIIAFLSNILRIVLYLLAGFIITSELGYDISGLVAGLSIGGLTISLAAQDTVKNFFGGVVIIFDKPFVIGDFIKTNDIEGTVIDITFRSTRLRTSTDHVVTIPNSSIVDKAITNTTKMRKRKITMDLLITLDTPLSKLKECSQIIEQYLIENEKCIDDSIYVRFNDIKDSGNNIFVSFFTTCTKYRDYLEVKEDVNYAIMAILEQCKVELAYPSQTVYVKK